MKKFLIFPILVFIVAAIFRIFFMDLIEFKFDEAFNVYQLTQFYLHPSINFHSGLSSSGMHNFPLLHYLLIILGVFSRDPQYLSFVIALINTVLVVIFYLVIRKFYGNFVAIMSSLVIATSPWCILYSRKIWHPDLTLIFLIPAFYFLHKIIFNKNHKAQIPLFAFLVLLIQQHFSGVYLLILTIVVLIISKIKINIKYFIIGVCLGLIPALPWILYNLSATPFCPDCKAYIAYQGQPQNFDFNNFLRPVQILNGLYFEDALGEDWNLFLEQYPQIKVFNVIFWLEGLIFLLGIVFIFLFNKKYIFLLIYLLGIPLIYFITRNPPRMHYFVILLPILAVVFGLTFKQVFNLTKTSFLKYLVLSIFIILILINLIFESYFYQFLASKKDIKGNFGPIYPLTRDFVSKKLAPYSFFPDYEELRSYAYVFAKPEILHPKLGEYFLQKKQITFATLEFQKALGVNEDDLTSAANLTYIYIITKDFNQAKKELDILSTKDATVSSKLKLLLEQYQKTQQ
ncbi:MAG: hypothetical protein V1808_00535 [Candidatus Daviesbacteria bacterium]